MLAKISSQSGGHKLTSPSGSHSSNIPCELQQFAQILSCAMRHSRDTPPTPTVFSGDPLTYTVWQRSIAHLQDPKISESDRLSYLHQFLSEKIKTFLQDPNVASSQRVLEKLDNIMATLNGFLRLTEIK